MPGIFKTQASESERLSFSARRDLHFREFREAAGGRSVSG